MSHLSCLSLSMSTYRFKIKKYCQHRSYHKTFVMISQIKCVLKLYCRENPTYNNYIQLKISILWEKVYKMYRLTQVAEQYILS